MNGHVNESTQRIVHKHEYVIYLDQQTKRHLAPTQLDLFFFRSYITMH